MKTSTAGLNQETVQKKRTNKLIQFGNTWDLAVYISYIVSIYEAIKDKKDIEPYKDDLDLINSLFKAVEQHVKVCFERQIELFLSRQIENLTSIYSQFKAGKISLEDQRERIKKTAKFIVHKGQKQRIAQSFFDSPFEGVKLLQELEISPRVRESYARKLTATLDQIQEFRGPQETAQNLLSKVIKSYSPTQLGTFYRIYKANNRKLIPPKAFGEFFSKDIFLKGLCRNFFNNDGIVPDLMYQITSRIVKIRYDRDRYFLFEESHARNRLLCK